MDEHGTTRDDKVVPLPIIARIEAARSRPSTSVAETRDAIERRIIHDHYVAGRVSARALEAVLNRSLSTHDIARALIRARVARLEAWKGSVVESSGPGIDDASTSTRTDVPSAGGAARAGDL